MSHMIEVSSDVYHATVLLAGTADVLGERVNWLQDRNQKLEDENRKLWASSSYYRSAACMGIVNAHANNDITTEEAIANDTKNGDSLCDMILGLEEKG